MAALPGGKSRMSARSLLSLAFLAALTGCAPLELSSARSDKNTNSLPRGRLAPDAVVLDIAFVRYAATDQATEEAIWKGADEQRFSVELRRALAANGLRVGLIGQQLPPRVQELLSEGPKLLEALSQGAAGDLEIVGAKQHLPVRAGHRSIIKASAVYPSLAVLLNEDGVVRGYDLRDARCIFSLKPYPQGDGRVKLAITPEIEHGESKTHWGGTEGVMIPQTGQERLILDRLQCDGLLSPGQTLILSCTPQIKGLGECFFSQNVSGALERRAILIRYSQTQFDDLFAPEQTSAPLTTPGE